MVGGEEGLEEDDGGDLIDDVASVDLFASGFSGEAGVVTVGVEERVGFLCGVAFVDEVEGEGGVLLAEEVGEGEGLDGLRAGCAVGVEWVADDEDFDGVLADETGDGFEVGARVWFGCGAVDGEEWTREDAE